MTRTEEIINTLQRENSHLLVSNTKLSNAIRSILHAAHGGGSLEDVVEIARDALNS